MNYPKRKQIRLQEYDYSNSGAYFVTICTHNRECIFGEINNKEIEYNEFRKIAYLEITNTQIKYQNNGINFENFIVMPNHIHMIIVINSLTDEMKINEFSKPIKNSLSTIIGNYKSAVTRKINPLIKADNNAVFHTIWQRGYFEHIIRNEKSYQEISEYIDNNVFLWKEDSLYKV